MEQKNIRNTRQKSIILQCLSEYKDKHITAEEIIDYLKSIHKPVGKATVYRFLKQLESEGALKKYFVSDGVCACYQYIGDKSSCNMHYHLMCDKCGEITHIESETIGSFADTIYNNLGFLIDERKTVFYGTCKNCKAKGGQ